MASVLDITEVNSLDEEQFKWIFSNVIELCTDAAVQVVKRRPFNSVDELCDAFHNYLDGLGQKEKVVVLNLHPDLAGRLPSQDELTKESSGEQRDAGLRDMSIEQREIMDSMNEKYKAKFGFPFIICARENKVPSIIEGLQRRYNNTRDQEIVTAIDEVKKICSLRILDIVHYH